MSFYRGEGGSGSGSVTSEPVGIGQGGTGATTAADARTNLGLGTIATQNANNIAVTGGTLTGITDLAITDGGTGASTASGARTNLGLATVAATGDYNDLSNKPTIPGNLDDLSDVTLTSPSVGQVLKYDGSVWTNQADAVSPGDVVGPNGATNNAVALFDGTTGLLLKDSTKTLPSGTILGSDAIGVSVQAYDAQLADIAGLTPTDSNFIVGNGTNFVTESGATARASLGLGTAATTDSTDYAPAAKGVTNGDSHDHNGGDGAQISYNNLSNLPSLGTIASQAANNVSITGGSITGITDLAVADGGTGASTAADARVNLLPSYTGNGSKVLALNSGATDVQWVTAGNGTVTSVDMTVPTGLAVSGNPITSSGTLAVTYASGYSIPTTSSQTNWDTAYTDRLKWDGGSTGLTPSTGRTSLGASTVGANIFTLTNPSAVTFVRMNADNTVTARSASELKTDLSLNNVENTALSTWAGSTNITTVGTVSTGTISGGTY